MPRIVRRQNPPAHSDYRRFKPYLRVDFDRRCAYCHIPELRNGPSRNYAVDHFRPKSRPEFVALRSQYSNLYYACHRCNDCKHVRWPSAEEQRRGYRFLDPCADDFTEHFAVQPDGHLQPLTLAAEYSSHFLQLNREYLREWRAEKAARSAGLQMIAAMIEEMAATGLTASPNLAALVQFHRDKAQALRDEFGEWWGPARG